MTFESFLNSAIPFVLVFLGLALIWWKAHVPLTALFNWLVSLTKGSPDKIVNMSKEIVYDI